MSDKDDGFTDTDKRTNAHGPEFYVDFDKIEGDHCAWLANLLKNNEGKITVRYTSMSEVQRDEARKEQRRANLRSDIARLQRELEAIK